MNIKEFCKDEPLLIFLTITLILCIALHTYISWLPTGAIGVIWLIEFLAHGCYTSSKQVHTKHVDGSTYSKHVKANRRSVWKRNVRRY